jgi:hypothetical protein
MSLFAPLEESFKFMLASLMGVSLLTGLFLSRIYLGWQYVRNRLKSDRIFYEESGWYDGQTWLKPTAMLNRDLLIVSYEIEPIMVRLRQTYGLIAALLGLCSLTWLIFA